MSAPALDGLRLLERDPVKFDTGGSVEFLLLDSAGIGVVAQRNVNPKSKKTLAAVRAAFRLFAAAPDLLAALRALLGASCHAAKCSAEIGNGRCQCGFTEAEAFAHTTIAKAVGK